MGTNRDAELGLGISGAAVRMVCMGAVHGYNGERAGEGGSAPLRACAMAIKLLGCFGISRTLLTGFCALGLTKLRLEYTKLRSTSLDRFNGTFFVS